MASCRNKLVHAYWKVGPEELHKIVKENLSDFDEFCDYIIKYIKKK